MEINMPFVQMNTDEMMIPVLIPRTSEPAVTGPNSMWLVAGAGLIGAALFGPKSNKKTSPPPKKIKIGK